MDKLDIAIVRELAQGVPEALLPAGAGPSLRAIGRTLSVSEGVVRGRIARLQLSGFLGPPRIIPNPDVLGLQQAAYFGSVAGHRAKEDVLRQIAAVEGIFLIANFHGPALGVLFSHEKGTPPRSKALLLDRLTGSKADWVTTVPTPLVALSPRRLDWKLMLSLCTYGPRPHAKLAHDLDTSVRTVKRRLSRLVGGRALLSFPRFNLRALSGGVVAYLLVQRSGQESQAHLESLLLCRFRDYVFYVGRWGEITNLAMVLPTPAAATEAARVAAAFHGVGSATCRIMDELIDQPAEIGDYLLARLTQIASTGKGVADGVGKPSPSGIPLGLPPGATSPAARPSRMPPSPFRPAPVGVAALATPVPGTPRAPPLPGRVSPPVAEGRKNIVTSLRVL